MHQLQAASSHLHLGTPKPRYLRVARAPSVMHVEKGVAQELGLSRVPLPRAAFAPQLHTAALAAGGHVWDALLSSPWHQEETPGSPPAPGSHTKRLAVGVSSLRRSSTAAGPPLPFALALCLWTLEHKSQFTEDRKADKS